MKNCKKKKTSGPARTFRGFEDKGEAAEFYARFVDLHFGTDGQHAGNIIIQRAAQKPHGGKVLRYVGFAKPEGIRALALGAEFIEGNSYYVTCNSFTRGMRRASDLFTLHNIVLDVDIHSLQGISAKEAADAMRRLAFFLEEDSRDYGFPAPNTIVFTGRGIQLWWALEPISAKCLKAYKYVAGFLAKQVQALIDDGLGGSGLSVDRVASGSPAGLYRLPLTFNRMAGVFGCARPVHGRRMDLMEACGMAHGLAQAQVPAYLRKAAEGDAMALAARRADGLMELARMRSEGRSPLEGQRDLFLFCMYNSVAPARGDAWGLAKVRELNASFPDPMPEAEWMGYLSTSRRKIAQGDPYVLTNKWVIGALGLTGEEQRHVRLFAAGTGNREEGRAAARAAKAERDRRILELAGDAGTKKEIAQKVGCSEGTVAKVLKENGKRTLKEKRRRTACMALLSGKAIKEAAKKAGQGIRQVQMLAKAISEKGLDKVIGKKHVPPAPAGSRKKAGACSAGRARAATACQGLAAADVPGSTPPDIGKGDRAGAFLDDRGLLIANGQAPQKKKRRKYIRPRKDLYMAYLQHTYFGGGPCTGCPPALSWEEWAEAFAI